MSDSSSLERATGYYELGMWAEAEEELSLLPDPIRCGPFALSLRIEIARGAGNWAEMAEVSRHLSEQDPENAGAWIALAFAERRKNSVGEAEKILEKVRNKFPGEAIIPFNLGCYACLQGDHDLARIRVLEAIALDPSFLKLAREDDDLVPLRDFFRQYAAELDSEGPVSD